MPNRIYILIFFLCSANFLAGQSANVNCASAFNIADPTSYCSGPDEFDNTGADGSEFEVPDCWDSGENDLWFSFSAVAKSVSVVINGETGGDLRDPQVILYLADDCSEIFEIGFCESTQTGPDVASIFAPNLIIGQNYFIRVSARFARQGSFQICVNSFNPPVAPGQDCISSTILCNKNSFVVENQIGGGADPNEGENTCLDIANLGDSEDGSTWFKWTCDESGTLIFDIIPLVPEDDFDFALFRLPNGLNSCELEVIRCNATAGGGDGECGINTGLDLTSTDLEEDSECDAGEDGYVRFIDMVAGESYALLVNNFSESESPFNLVFGGTGTFLGPTADFEVVPNPVNPCENEFVVNDLSTSGVNAISSYEW